MIKVGDIIEGKLSMNASGSAYLESDQPKDIYVNKRNTGKGLHLDTVKIEVIAGKGRPLEGRVIEVVERFKTEFVGTLQVFPSFAFLKPDSPKMSVDIYIPVKKLNGGQDGQKAIAKITSWKDDAKSPNGEILEVLGEAGENDVEIHSILHEYDLPYRFNEDVLAEANMIPTEISDEEIAKRRDMRDVLTFTIDPDTAKDFDDALSYEVLDDGFIRVGIHIADVSYYVRPDTDLDREAYERGTSVYLVDRVVPMLPEHLSNGVCSLRPKEDKLCFSAIFDINPETGRAEKEWFGRTVIHSDIRLTYEEAQEFIEHTDEELEGEPFLRNFDFGLGEVTKAVRHLDKIAKLMRSHRFQRGSISLNKHEVKFILDDNGKPVDLVFRYQKDANRLIEEYMLLANRRVARYINKKRLPMVQRIHESPDPVKLEHLKEFTKEFDYTIDLSTPATVTASLNQLLLDVEGKPEQNMIENLVVRSMMKAKYSTENVGHYGLGFEDYTHFTSPIRRYPDVIAHRLLHHYLERKQNVKVEKLEAKCQYLSLREVKAKKAQRDSIKYKQAEYLSERIGKVYKGMITSVTDFGMFIELEENKCEGMIRISEIGGDIFYADMPTYTVKGHNTGESFRLGDMVTVAVKDVDIEKKTVDLMLIRL